MIPLPVGGVGVGHKARFDSSFGTLGGTRILQLASFDTIQSILKSACGTAALRTEFL